tara:strand:+ start:196 stop:426 length:231 start_codon:yes stop_codon:yes gene_type:complete
VFSALNGQYGLFNKYKYQAQEIALRNNLNEKKLQTSQLEKKVHRLSEKFLDIDLLDEQSRKLLGLAKPNEIIIQLN